MACCPVGDFCRGTVNYGTGAGTGTSGETGAGSGGSASTSVKEDDGPNQTTYGGPPTVETDASAGGNIFSGNGGSAGGSLYITQYPSRAGRSTRKVWHNAGYVLAVLIWMIAFTKWY